jgi:hypothetical protein
MLLFIGLYFYIQNVRFLNSTTGSNFTPIHDITSRTTPLYYYITFIVLFFIIFGVFYTEDLILIVSWLIL